MNDDEYMKRLIQMVESGESIGGSTRSTGASRSISKPINKDKGNLFTNSLSTVGGIVGGIGGSFLAPGIGTAALGAGGAGLGKFLENVLEGNKDLGEGIIGEAALGTLGGIGKGFRAVKGAADALKGGRGAAEAGSIMRLGVPKTTGVASKGSSILGGTTTRARELDAKTSGLGVGQKLNGQLITPQRSQELYEFARSRGVKAGSPMAQTKQAESLLRGTTQSLDDTLTSINRPVSPSELASLKSAISSNITDNAAVTGTTKTMDKFVTKIAKAKDLKSLEAIRREADNLAYSATGAKKTSAAAQAKAVRETIDDLVSGVSPGYKAVKNDYRNAKDLLELTAKTAGSGKGGIDILGNRVGSSIIPSAISKGSAMLGGAGRVQPVAGTATQSGARGGVPDWAKITGMQLGGRALTGNLPGPDAAPSTNASSLLGGQGITPATSQLTPQTAGATGLPSLDGGSAGAPSMYSLENAAMDIQNDLQRTGGENMDKYLKLYEFLNPVDTKADKPLSAEASKVLSNANSGLTSLGQLSGMINEGGVPLGTVLPGREMLGGLGANILGTSGYDTAARNVADVITRLRTGAALTESEERFYKSQLPQAFDPPEVRAQKLQMFEDLFNSVANRTGTAGTDVQSMLASY